VSKKGRLSLKTLWTWWRVGREVAASSTITLKGLQSSVTENRIKVSAESRALHNTGLYGRVVQKKPLLKKIHVKARLELGKKYKRDPVGMWEVILWSWWEQYETFLKSHVSRTSFLQSIMVMIRSCCILLKSKEEWMVKMNCFSLLKKTRALEKVFRHNEQKNKLLLPWLRYERSCLFSLIEGVWCEHCYDQENISLTWKICICMEPDRTKQHQKNRNA